MYALDRWFSIKSDPQGERFLKKSQNWFWSLSKVLKKRKSNNQSVATNYPNKLVVSLGPSVSWKFSGTQNQRLFESWNIKEPKLEVLRFWRFSKNKIQRFLPKSKNHTPYTGSNFHHFSWFCCKAPQPGSNFHLFWWTCWLCLSGKDYCWIHLVPHFQEHFLLQLVGRKSWVLSILFLHAPKYPCARQTLCNWLLVWTGQTHYKMSCLFTDVWKTSFQKKYSLILQDIGFIWGWHHPCLHGEFLLLLAWSAKGPPEERTHGDKLPNLVLATQQAAHQVNAQPLMASSNQQQLE